MKTQYDVIVIGSGPGGEGAAMKCTKECTKEGLHAAMCDYFSMIGGSCTHKYNSKQSLKTCKPNFI